MADRIDHAAEAVRAGQQAERAGRHQDRLEHLLNANVHATMALVEQQRLANLIAALTLTPSRLADETIKADASEVTRARIALRNAIRAEVREGLGL